jgi:hypothetical protein
MKNANDDAAVAFIMVVVVIAFAIAITIRVFFLLTLSRCLSRIQDHNRDMQPGLVWLNLIPCVYEIFIFFTVVWLVNSLRKEFRDRGWRIADEAFGQSVGLG